MLRTQRILSSLLLTCTLAACDSEDDPSDEMMESSSGQAPTTDPSGSDPTGADDQGRCAPDMAVLSCDAADCAFEVAEIDCATACANIAAVCDANACAEQCTGMESDPTLCGAACEGTKALMCSNVVFGCYATNNSCNDVGNCVEANK